MLDAGEFEVVSKHDFGYYKEQPNFKHAWHESLLSSPSFILGITFLISTLINISLNVKEICTYHKTHITKQLK